MIVIRKPSTGVLPPGGSPGQVLGLDGAGKLTWLTVTGGGGGGAPPGAVAYSQYRLNISQNSGDSDYVEVAEFRLLNPQGQNVATGGAPSASNVSFGAASDASKAFDNDAETIWIAAAGPQNLKYTLGSPATLASYTLTSGSTGDRSPRAPKAWTLEGSNDGASWTVLHTVADAGAWTGGQTKTYTI